VILDFVGFVGFFIFTMLYTRDARASGDYKDQRWEEANQHERYLHNQNVSRDITLATICCVAMIWCGISVIKELLCYL
jgi:hypothetical protein